MSLLPKNNIGFDGIFASRSHFAIC